MSIVVRTAIAADLPEITRLYNHYVLETSITFDLEPKTLEDRHAWFEQFDLHPRHQLLVSCTTGKVHGDEVEVITGYACSHRFREKQAYETSVETTIYLDADVTGGGVGTALYTALFDRLASQDVHRAFAGITLPNAASIALHEKFGFKPLGVFKEVGRKFGQYWDVGWYEKPL